MKYVKKNLLFFIGYLVFGGLLVIVALLWAPEDQRSGIISGISCAFLVTGVGGILLSLRLLKNPEKAEQVEVQKTEERSQYLRMKTQSAVQTVMVFVISAGTLIALVAGYRTVSYVLAALLILGVILYIAFGQYFARHN
jgi:hypothetical protein